MEVPPDERPHSVTAETRRSGQIRVRMPASLHAELARAAAAERVSLNQFICSALAAAVQWRPSAGHDPGSAAASAGRPRHEIENEQIDNLLREWLR
jgi:hypothetical protein